MDPDIIVVPMQHREMDISPTKSAVLLFTRCSVSNISLTTQKSQIAVTSSHRFLEVILDWELAGSKHVNMLKQNVSRTVSSLPTISSTSWGTSTLSLFEYMQQYSRPDLGAFPSCDISHSSTLDTHLNYQWPTAYEFAFVCAARRQGCSCSRRQGKLQ